MKYIFILIFCIWNLSFAEDRASIHQLEKEKYSRLPKHASFFDLTGKGIIPLAMDKVSTPTKAVFGYLPYWEYQTAPQYLQYDLLSHIAAFEFPVSADGTVTYPSYWPWTDVINAAHANGVKMIMCTTNFDTDEIHTLLTNASSKDNFFSNIKSIIESYSLQGVNVDFENIATDDRGALLNSFISDLTTYIHSELPGSEVSFAGPAVNWGGWDLSGLAASCDYIFIMGYDFYGSWSSTSGPCAPLTGGSHNVTNTVEVQYGEITENNPEKLILGVPYYGTRWQTESSEPYATVLEYINHPRYSDAWPQSATYGLLWDNQSQTPWYAYQDNGDWKQVWFDTDTSLGLKYDLSENHNLRGVGMWALGYDGSYPELWEELRRRYGQPSALNGPSFQEQTFELFQNFPNPFNPYTVFSYRLKTKSEIRLTIYNNLGQRVATLAKGTEWAGIHKIRWDGSDFSAGIYYLKLSVNNKWSQTKKIILLK